MRYAEATSGTRSRWTRSSGAKPRPSPTELHERIVGHLTSSEAIVEGNDTPLSARILPVATHKVIWCTPLSSPCASTALP